MISKMAKMGYRVHSVPITYESRAGGGEMNILEKEGLIKGREHLSGVLDYINQAIEQIEQSGDRSPTVLGGAINDLKAGLVWIDAILENNA